MAKLKIVLAAALAVLLLVIILQNTQTVETRVLFISIEMPRAALLFLMLLIGFAGGLLAALGFSRRSKAAGGRASTGGSTD